MTLFKSSSTLAQSSSSPCPPGIPCTNDFSSYKPGEGANNQKTASEGCDADFMNQIYARAYMESERESTLFKDFIAKPDSVMEYSCFDKHLSVTAQKIGPLFTENNLWANKRVNIATTGTLEIPLRVFMGADRTDKSIKNLVLDSLNAYRKDNFSHNFLGGKANINSSFSTTTNAADYKCSAMQEVWTLAKCANFSSNKFYRFSEIAREDPRKNPQNCGGTAITQNLIDVANNKDFAYSKFDPINTYLERTLAVGTDPATDCAPPVATGLKVSYQNYNVEPGGSTQTQSQSNMDYVCPNPACYYDAQATKKCKR